MLCEASALLRRKLARRQQRCLWDVPFDLVFDLASKYPSCGLCTDCELYQYVLLFLVHFRGLISVFKKRQSHLMTWLCGAGPKHVLHCCSPSQLKFTLITLALRASRLHDCRWT